VKFCHPTKDWLALQGYAPFSDIRPPVTRAMFVEMKLQFRNREEEGGSITEICNRL
jgi:hypothetical protein